jgi:hypothetical protein
MDIVTMAGTGRHVASWRSYPGTTPLSGVVAACEPQDEQSRHGLRLRQRDLRNRPTDPQRPSAPSRWVT